MKKKITFIFLTLFFSVLILSNQSYSQFKDYSFKLGLQGNYLLPGTEWTPEGASLLFRPNLTLPILKMFDLNFGVGYGWLSSKDYSGTKTKTTFIPVDVRLIFAPIQATTKNVNPYIYLGAAGAYWSLDPKPTYKDIYSVDKDNGITGLGEAGLGLEIALSKKWILDVTGGFNVFATDDVNGQASNLNDKFLHDYDRYFNIGLGIEYAFENCSADDDKDGLGICEEEKLGTDPNNPDTDGDGLTDGDEVLKYKTNPLKADTDGDGLNDGDEVMKYKTDPNKADSDGDGLNDGDEVMKYKTDPLKVDTDGDGLGDGDEVLKYKTDPLNPDTDGDGLKDGEEVMQYKTDPLSPDTDKDGLTDGDEVMKYKTDPLNADTDNDGLKDGEEVNGFTITINLVDSNSETRTVKTDPLKSDTDGDGLSDGAEVNGADVTILNAKCEPITVRCVTDPTMMDTDGGGVNDGTEVNGVVNVNPPVRTNPLNRNDDWLHGNAPLKLQVEFAEGKAVIQQQYIPGLQSLLEPMKQFLCVFPKGSIIIDGYTNSRGSERANLALSQRRARAVSSWFINQGINRRHIQAIGHGETDLKYLSDGTEDFEGSRRIELRSTH